MLTEIIRDDFFEIGTSIDLLYLMGNNTVTSQFTFDHEVSYATLTLQKYYNEHVDDKWLVLCHNNLHRLNVAINNDGPFDQTQLLLLGFESVGYGFRVWDLIDLMIISEENKTHPSEIFDGKKKYLTTIYLRSI